MGAFFLHCKSGNKLLENPPEGQSPSRRVFAAKGLSSSGEFHHPLFDLFVFHKRSFSTENFIAYGDKGFICATGTLVLDHSVGRAALESIYASWNPEGDMTKSLRGEFALIVFKDGRLDLCQSRSGLYHIFADRTNEFISTSLLAVREACRATTLGTQEYFEYVLNGAVYGDCTLFEEIRLLDRHRHFQVLPEWREHYRPAPLDAGLDQIPLEQAANRVSGAIDDYFEMVAGAFGSDVCSALSGGFDSRLILGHMRRRSIEAYLYVYGSPDSSDVKVARRIAEGEGIPLDHIDRGHAPQLSAESYRDLLNRQFYLCDSLTNTGIFDDGQALATRLDRIQKARLQLNGGGGEIYRNFWLLPDRSFTAHQFLQSKYDRFDYSPFTAEFRKGDYFSHLAEKVLDILGTEGNRLTPRQIAMLYPYFRLRYWMGMNNSHNTQFAYSLTPFGDQTLVDQSLSLPPTWKNEGVFESRLIQIADAKLASYPSCYGFNFLENPGLKRRLKGALERRVPVALRPWLRRKVHNKGRSPAGTLPYFLQPRFLEEIGISKMPATGHLVDIQGIRSPDILSRALSVEILMQGGV